MLIAFDFLATLIGRDWVTIWEVAEKMGRHYRTVRRYALAAEMAGMVEYRMGISNAKRPEDRAAVRLVNARMRRAA
jgi:predicted transcriptional regulator